MSWLSRLANVFRGSRIDRDLDDELRFHVDARLAELMQQGLTRADAEAQAARMLGNRLRLREESREIKLLAWLQELGQDLRYGLRVLRKSPSFTIAVVGALGLGIGANTAIFALLDQVLLRALPVERPHELALVRIDGVFNGTTTGDGHEISYPMYVEIRDHNEVFAGMFARFGRFLHVGHGTGTERAAGELVSGTFFDVLGVRPARGRLFTAEDDRVQNGHPVAVLSHQYWASRFARDEAIVGQSLTINGHPYTVIGIAEERFTGMSAGGQATQVFVPMQMQLHVLPNWNFLADPRSRFAHVYGRLRPGVSFSQAQASLQPLFRAIRERELTDRSLATAPAHVKQEFLKATLEVAPGFQGVSRLRQTLARPLWVLTVIVAGLLLIACANVAALLVARGIARQREIAIRLALGGSRWRIVRQLLVESLLLAIVGAAAGVLLAAWGSNLLLGLLVDRQTSVLTAQPDARVLAFNFGLALATALLFGVLPAWQATRPVLARTLKDRASSVLGGRHLLLRKGLVVAQVALSLFLLVGAGLFVRSLGNLLAQDLGFTATNLLSFSVDGALNGYTGARAQQFHRALIDRVAALPGVTASALTTLPLLQGFSWQSPMTVEHHAEQGEEVVAHINAVSPGYFEALQIPILSGRGLTLNDGRSEPLTRGAPFRVAVANQRFVDLYFAGANPIGRRVGIGGNVRGPLPIEIVGIAGNAKYKGVRDRVEPQLYLSFFEHPGPDGATVYVRTTHAPDQMFAALRRTMQEIDPALPLFRMRTMEEHVERSLSNERLLAGLSTAFGLCATLLAVVGLYGVMSYIVVQRRREIGIRVALGAVSRRIAWLFVREALALVVLGCALALPLLWIAGRYVQSQLYGIGAFDPATVATSVLALAAVAAAGSFVPARRGARIHPLGVLREE